MSAPVSIARTHVHSIRLASGAEALVARVLASSGAAGFGFNLGLEAAPARDMAAWDAAARERNAPLYALLGGKRRDSVAVTGSTALPVLDPFGLGSLDATLESAGARAVALLARHGHPWEIAWCAAIAAVLEGQQVRVFTPDAPGTFARRIPPDPGIGIDWSIEPSFETVRWLGA